MAALRVVCLRNREVVQRREGFGFIAPDDGSTDILVHHSVIESNGYRSPEENQRVEFTASRGPKGMQADQVRGI
ncbi:cold-shock protein [Streptomyces sp. 4N509B]|uniref:cold-shock protein n=1 Tax=Streptomyces sp. 4N509B TaxID=3457413 RepID=UPI003FD20897